MSQVISSKVNNAAIVATRNAIKESSGPWWKFPIVWMVVMLPLSVVVASAVSFYIASHSTDTVIDNKTVHVDSISKPDVKVKIEDANMLPSMVGRNHAATNEDATQATFEQGVVVKK